MKRSLSILTGPEAGKIVPLDAPLFAVGRSSKMNLQIDDPLVSRCHLEIKVEGERVTVEDKSSRGTQLNGKKIQGSAALSHGDILELGHIQVRYDEAGEAPQNGGDDLGPLSAGMSGTKFMDRMDDLRGMEPGPEATRAVAAEMTRMLNPSDLPKWKAPTPAKVQARKMGLVYLVIGCVVLIVGGLYWIQYRQAAKLVAGGAMERYADPIYALAISYPEAWTRFPAKPETPLIVGQGQLDQPLWVRMRVDVDRSIQYETTGLTEGFRQYQNSMKPNYSFVGTKLMTVNEVSCMFYVFKIKNGQGKGLFLLNGGTRIIVECSSSMAGYPQQAALFSKLLTGFSLTEAQQSIDFPLPDDAMQKQALANPEWQMETMRELKRNADSLVASRNVKQANLYHAIQDYKRALQLSLARPERAPGSDEIARGLSLAITLYKQAIRQQRYEIKRAMKEGDTETAYWAAHKMLQMIPDKTDAVNQEANQLLRRLSLKK